MIRLFKKRRSGIVKDEKVDLEKILGKEMLKKLDDAEY